MTQPKVDKVASARIPTKGVASIKSPNQHEQPKVDNKWEELQKELEGRLQMIPSAFDRRKFRGIIQRIRTADKKKYITQTQQETLEMIKKIKPTEPYKIDEEGVEYYHGADWDEGYNQALKDMRQTIKKKIGGIK